MQCENIEGLRYEIIVADDGSTDTHARLTNKEMLELANVVYLQRRENVGRARIRNVLARRATSAWLLFVDSDMTVCRDDFVLRYAELDDAYEVACGGYLLGHAKGNNLRFLYEKQAADSNTLARRNLHPYHNLHTANLLMRRETAFAHPFDERFRRYGYEDVLLGKQLMQAGTRIIHIDNPLLFADFESNTHFMQKTEEALQTLHTFREELRGFSRLLDVADKIRHLHLQPLVDFYWKRRKKSWRACLCGNQPKLKCYKYYRLGYFLSLFS